MEAKIIKAECPDFTAELKISNVGVTTVNVTKKQAQGGSAPLPPVKKERTSGWDKWDEARIREQQAKNSYSFTAGSEAQARQELQQRTKHKIRWTGAHAHVRVGDVAKFKDKGLSVEDARKQMLEAGQAPKGLASEKAKNDAVGAAPPKPAQQPAGIVLTHEEKVELANKRAMAFMNQHPEFVSSGFNWERMLRCAIDHGFIPDAKSPATVEQWEICWEYLKKHRMIPTADNPTAPCNPYQFITEEQPSTPSGSAQKRGLDEARWQLKNLSTDDLARLEAERQAKRKAEKNAARLNAPVQGEEILRALSLKTLADAEHERQAEVISRRRGEF